MIAHTAVCMYVLVLHIVCQCLLYLLPYPLSQPVCDLCVYGHVYPTGSPYHRSDWCKGNYCYFRTVLYVSEGGAVVEYMKETWFVLSFVSSVLLFLS